MQTKLKPNSAYQIKDEDKLTFGKVTAVFKLQNVTEQKVIEDSFISSTPQVNRKIRQLIPGTPDSMVFFLFIIVILYELKLSSYCYYFLLFGYLRCVPDLNDAVSSCNFLLGKILKSNLFLKYCMLIFQNNFYI